MKFLLDTNVFSELLKPVPSPEVLAWMEVHQGDCGMSALTLAEMADGVESLPAGKRRNALTKALSFLQEDYAERILPFDERAAWEWARYLREAQDAGHSPPLLDSLIAATARTWGLKLVSRNEADFPLIEVLNPFES